MTGVEVFENAYKELAFRFEGLTKDVYLISPDHMKGCSDLLNLCQVKHDEMLYFNDESADLGDYGRGDAGGVTINFLLDGKGRSAVFINENCLPHGTKEDLIWMWRYNSLHHELMHTLDFNKQKNFNTSRRTLDVVGAEAFADHKTLMHLKSKSSCGFMKIALQQYAINAQTLRDKGGIKSAIYTRLTQKIDSKTIDYWATMNI